MIDLATAKAHLRVGTIDEDALITAYLAAAQAAVENFTSKLLTQQSVQQDFAGFPLGGRNCFDRGLNRVPAEALRLWQGPVSAILSIDYDDVDGVQQTLTDFRFVDGLMAVLLPAYGSSWPVAQNEAGSVRVTYTAGYADGAVPPAFDQAVLFLVAHYYANREAVNADVRAAAVELPLGIEMLLAPYAAPGIA